MENISFGMKAIKFHRSSFERQIHESVLIQSNRTHWLLNSKAEFNRCAIPRLGLKMGEKEYKEKGKELKEEEEKEAQIEEKIKQLRKNINKYRNPRRPDKNQPERKRRKVDTSADQETRTEEEIWLEEKLEREIHEKEKEIDAAKQDKRKRKISISTEHHTTPKKRQNKQADIRSFCKENVADQTENKRRRLAGTQESIQDKDGQNLQIKPKIPN